MKTKYKSNETIKIYNFINNIKTQYNAADLVISRAGATAISEIIFLNKPSILIPYPQAANNHQVLNASTLNKKNAAIMIYQNELKNDVLEKEIIKLKKNKNLLIKMKNNIDKIKPNNTESNIVNAINQIINKND